MSDFKLPFEVKIEVATINRAFGVTSERADEMADSIQLKLQKALNDNNGLTDIEIISMFIGHAKNVEESYFLSYQAGRICEMLSNAKGVRKELLIEDGQILSKGGSC